jgi:hypothetical protein
MDLLQDQPINGVRVNLDHFSAKVLECDSEVLLRELWVAFLLLLTVFRGDNV